MRDSVFQVMLACGAVLCTLIEPAIIGAGLLGGIVALSYEHGRQRGRRDV